MYKSKDKKLPNNLSHLGVYFNEGSRPIFVQAYGRNDILVFHHALW